MAECNSCKYRGNVPGSAHSSCNNPVVSEQNKSMIMLTIMTGRGHRLKPVLGLSFDPHGVSSGWCSFPFDFDPIWVSGKCKIKEEAEKIPCKEI